MRIRCCLILVFGLASFVLPSLAMAQQQWKLVWSDEFEYHGLPDPSKWDYEVGMLRNHEEQCYTKTRLENARVEDGMLVIEGRKEHFANPAYDPAAKADSPKARKFADYTSASLVTKGKADWTFGRLEVRAKEPQGKGVWPAIWMLGCNVGEVGWPRCGEIDVVEFVGQWPNQILGTAHLLKDGKHAKSEGKLVVEKPFDDFHVYAVEWFPDHMDFFFDQRKYHTFQISEVNQKDGNPFLKPQFLLLNLALGGDWGGAIDNSVMPQKYLIDYVRVYQDARSQAMGDVTKRP